jgi:hypothetical protein
MTNITIIAIFKDPRQLKEYSCCNEADYDNFSFLSREIENRVTKTYLSYYRQY